MKPQNEKGKRSKKRKSPNETAKTREKEKARMDSVSKGLSRLPDS